MFGETLHEAVGSGTNLNAAATTAALTKVCYIPGTVLYWGIRITTVFSLTGANLVKGILALKRYTKKIQTAVLGNAAGTGYAVGDLLSVTQTGASGGILRVKTAPAGLVATVEIVNPGINYIAGSNLATVALNGAGDNAFTVTIDDALTLDTMLLEDLQVARKMYIRRVPNAIADVSPTPKPPACFDAGEELVVYVDTMATADTTETGAYMPFVIFQNRGENIALQDLWIEKAVGVAVSPPVPNY